MQGTLKVEAQQIMQILVAYLQVQHGVQLDSHVEINYTVNNDKEGKFKSVELDNVELKIKSS